MKAVSGSEILVSHDTSDLGIANDDAFTHERFMRAALAFGRRSMGRAAPNPAVGALVVKNGIVLGRGVTAVGGRPHAEPIALMQAGPAALGATLYVTLEPCSHHGRTPPCVDAVLASGVTRVVAASRDPDSRVAGSGFERLRQGGVEVIEGVCAAEAHRDHLGHIRRVTLGRPAVTLKMAETANGLAASLPGDPRWMITGPAANAYTQVLRATHDAIMVGSDTALADDPRLSVRLPGLHGRLPARIVLDSGLRLPPTARLVQENSGAPVIIFSGSTPDYERRAALERAGVDVCRAPAGQDRWVLEEALTALGDRGFTRVLCEGGPRLGSSLVTSGAADCVVLFTSDRSSASPGLPALSPEARMALDASDAYLLVDDARLGGDRLRVYERKEG